MKKSYQITLGAVALAAGVLSVANTARATAFSAGDLVVERTTTGTPSGTSAPVFVDEYTTAANQTATVQTIALPSTGSGAFTSSNSASSEGLINLSPDNTLTLAGYNTPSGTASVSTTATEAVGVINSAGTFSIAATGPTQSNNFRSAISSGSAYYGSNGTTGINIFNGDGTETQISSTVVNTRALEIYNGNLYFSTGSGTHGIYQVGTGLPTTSGQTATNILQLGSSSSPYGFSINSAGTYAFVVDSTAGTLSKYAINGTSGGSAQTAISSVSGVSGVTGMTVSYSGNTATIYLVTPTKLYSVTDTISGTSGDFGTLTTLATAGTGFAFRGVDFVPTAAMVPEPATWLAGALSVLMLAGAFARRGLGLFGA